MPNLKFEQWILHINRLITGRVSCKLSELCDLYDFKGAYEADVEVDDVVKSMLIRLARELNK